MTVNSQNFYDTIYFNKYKVEIKDSSFVGLLDSLINSKNNCVFQKKNDIFGIKIYKIDTSKNVHSIIYNIPNVVELYNLDTTQNVFEANITQLSEIGVWCSKSIGYFYFKKSLFFIDGQFPENFLIQKKQKKRFFYKVPTKNMTEDFLFTSNVRACVLILQLYNKKWIFSEQRRDY